MKNTSEFISISILVSPESHLHAIPVARAFLGMIVYRYLVEEVFGVPHAQALSTRELAKELVGIFLDGISANRLVSKNGAGRKAVCNRSARSRLAKTLAVFEQSADRSYATNKLKSGIP